MHTPDDGPESRHLNDPWSVAGHAVGFVLVLALVVTLTPTQVLSVPNSPLLVETSYLSPAACRTVLQDELAVARQTGQPRWVWADEELPGRNGVVPKAPESRAEDGVPDFSYRRSAPAWASARRPVPYAVASDALGEADVGACRFANNAVHVLPKSVAPGR